jgi:uncharacterized protein HemX
MDDFCRENGYERALKSGTDAVREFQRNHKDNGLAAFVANTKEGERTVANYQKYIGSANQALKQLSLGAKVASAASKVLNVALNMAISFGIGMAIEAVVKGISEFVNTQEIAIEKAKELSKSWEEQASKLKSAEGIIKSSGKKYEELSRGVGALGENIGLATEEYEQYNQISNDIGNAFPELIQGYTDEGTAILKVKGNLDA